MQTKLVTTNLILETLTKWVSEKQPISATTWSDVSLKLAVLLTDENSLLYDMQQVVALLRVKMLDDGKSVAEAKARIEATDEYKHAKTQGAKIEQITEIIRLAKKNISIALDEKNFS